MVHPVFYTKDNPNPDLEPFGIISFLCLASFVVWAVLKMI